MLAWWESLGIFGQVLACVAIPSTLLLVIQTIMTFIGMSNGGDTDTDAGADLEVSGDISDTDGVFGDDLDVSDHDAAGLADVKIFTFRGIVAFFAIFGWLGIVLYRAEVSIPLTLVFSALAGACAMVGIAFLFRLFYNLQYDGSENIRNSLGAAGSVYLAVPPSRTGKGKVTLMLQGRYVERDAVTDEEESLKFGSEVTVIGVIGGSTLLVKRK